MIQREEKKEKNKETRTHTCAYMENVIRLARVLSNNNALNLSVNSRIYEIELF
jgi:hypothetical protein